MKHVIGGILLLLPLCHGTAFADQLTLGSDGTLYFCSTGNAGSPLVISTTAGCNPAGGSAGSSNTGSFDSPNGNQYYGAQPWTITFPAINPLSLGNLSSNSFTPIDPQGTSSFSWGGANGVGQVTGVITWTAVNAASTNTPQFVGNLLVQGNTGTGPLLADYPVNKTTEIDFTVKLQTSPSLADVYNHNGGVTSTSGYFSSGEVPSVPEPGSIALYGTGVLAAFAFVRYRLRTL